MQLSQILSAPILFSSIVLAILIFVTMRKGSRLPEIDHFGLSKNEQLWLANYQKRNSPEDIMSFLVVIVLTLFLADKGQLFGVLVIVYCAIWMDKYRGRKVVLRLLDYINKLEQKK